VPQPLVFETFAGRVGQEFRIAVDGVTSVVATLTSATPHDATRVAAGFSLVFTGPVEPLLPQRIYRMLHGDLGEIDIFIVPIGRDGSGARYEAVFN